MTTGNAEDLAGLAADAAIGSSQGQPAAQDDAIAAKIRAWFTEAWNHPLWVRYRKDSVEDLGFYTGGDGQWSEDGSIEGLLKLRKEQRAHISLNHVQSVVDVVVGYERQNRFDLKAAPMGDEDAEQAELMTLLMKHEQERTEAHSICSEIFEDGLIGGMKAVEVSTDWTSDPVNGEIMLESLEPGEEALWDPIDWGGEPDLRNCRYVLRFRRAWVEDVVADFPEHEDRIRKAVGDVDQAFAAREGGTLSEFSRTDGYGSSANHPDEDAALRQLFYDKAGGRILVVQAWYREYEDAWIVSDKRSGTVTAAESAAAARESAAADPDNLTAINRRRRVIRTATVLPATLQTLEEDDTPYDNDREAYPIHVYVAKKKRDTVYGIVRNLKDPQRVENKRESQSVDLVAKMGNLRLVYETNSLENPATLKDPWSQEPIAVKPGHQKPDFLVPPLGELVRVLAALGDRNRLAIREISGINTDLLGIKSDDASGIAIARRQAQGQVISTVFFDNYRRFRKALGHRLARRIQQVYTTERTMRLTGPHGNDILVTLNALEARDMDKEAFARFREERKAEVGTPRILKDVSALKFDVVISETPATPTARAMALLAVLEILKTLPGLAPAFLDIVVELAELPDRERLLQRVHNLMDPRVLGEAPAGGGVGPGAPKPPGVPEGPPGFPPQGGTPIGLPVPPVQP